MKSLIASINRFAAKYTHRQIVNFNLARSVVSFTFDDFPRSALEQGGFILEQHNVRGTFYCCAELNNTVSPSGLIASKEDLEDCIKRGHELGCHTYNHMDCSLHTNTYISEAIKKNQQSIRSITTLPLQHFSYPYGRAGMAAKKTAMHHYKSARTTLPGVNQKTIDLGMLKAVPLYSRSNSDVWRTYLHQLSAKSGWLIFYTHDISAHPSHYGCTIQELQAVVAQALEMGYDVMPIGHVVDQLIKQSTNSTY